MAHRGQTGAQPSHRVSCLMDVGPAVHQRAGLSRYAERLASSLADGLSDDVALALFYNRHSNHTVPATLARLPQFSVPAGQYRWRLTALTSQMTGTVYRPLDLIARSLAARGDPSSPLVYHATEHLLPRLSCATVLTVHDVIFARFPQYHTRVNRLFLQMGMPLFVRSATRIIAVSETTRQDIVSRYTVSPDRIHVVYEGIDPDFTPAAPAEIRRVRERYSEGQPYLLMVGSIEPRKNHRAAIEALVRLKADGFPHRLLIAGAQGWMVEPILRHARESSVSPSITFLDFVPQNDLAALYSSADILLLPSWYEGFGFTALEAMACGTPVICSNVGSLPEVTAGSAIYVAPADVAGLVQSIRNVLDQPRLRDTLVRKGLATSARFRWTECARETLDVYREAAEMHPHQ